MRREILEDAVYEMPALAVLPEGHPHVRQVQEADKVHWGLVAKREQPYDRLR